MTLLLAAVGATMTALLDLSVGPYLRIGTAQPHLVLVLAIVVTVAVGLEAGLTFGFVGGLVLDVLAQRPLGSTAFALLLCAGIAYLLSRFVTRLRPILPIPATFLLSLVYSMTSFLALNALRAAIPIADPGGAIVPGAVYDAMFATLIGPLAVSIHDRRPGGERVDW
jgi:rod shape-determining protein MreD